MKNLLPLMFLSFTSVILAQDYCPIDIGNSWTYYFFDDGVFTSDSLVRTITKDTIVNNKKYYKLEQKIGGSIGDTTLYFYFREEGNEVTFISSLDSLDSKQLEKFGQHTFTDGDLWISTSGDTAKIEFVEKYPLIEACYDDCYSIITETSMEDSTILTYAPNIGLINTDIYLRDDNKNYSWILGDYYFPPVNNSENLNTNYSSYEKLFEIKNSSIISLINSNNLKGVINIYTINGKKCYSGSLENKKQLDLNKLNLSKGTYIVEVNKEILKERRPVHIFN